MVVWILITSNSFKLRIEHFHLTRKKDPQITTPLAIFDQGAMARKWYSTFPKFTELKPHHKMQFIDIPLQSLWGLPLSRVSVGLFYSPRKQGSSLVSCFL